MKKKQEDVSSLIVELAIGLGGFVLQESKKLWLCSVRGLNLRGGTLTTLALGETVKEKGVPFSTTFATLG